MSHGGDGLNRSTRINTRIKCKLTFVQVSCDHKKTKTVPCGELVLALPLSGATLIIRISVWPRYCPTHTLCFQQPLHTISHK